jgi:hypothetical protein
MNAYTQQQQSPIKSAWLQKTIENLVVSFKSEETRQWLQVFIVDPVIQYVMEKSFPYVVMCIVIIAAMILLTVSTFLLVFFRTGSTSSIAACVHCASLKVY